MVRSFVRDILYAVRGFLAAPAFALTAIIALGLAFGANAAVFSVVDALQAAKTDPATASRHAGSASVRK